MSALSYRIMSDQDLACVVKNERAAYAFPWTEGIFRDCLTGRNESWVVCYDGQIVGHGIISVAVGEGHLLNVCIAKRWQRQGFGAQLLNYLISRASDLGADVMFLEVRASNQGAIALYEKQGFNLVGERRNYYPGPEGREDAMIMSLVLNVDSFA